jgi:hypothetical protein
MEESLGFLEILRSVWLSTCIVMFRTLISETSWTWAPSRPDRCDSIRKTRPSHLSKTSWSKLRSGQWLSIGFLQKPCRSPRSSTMLGSHKRCRAQHWGNFGGSKHTNWIGAAAGEDSTAGTNCTVRSKIWVDGTSRTEK